MSANQALHADRAGLSEILVGLIETRVDFILVGGLAAVIQGAPVTTMDADVVQGIMLI